MLFAYYFVASDNFVLILVILLLKTNLTTGPSVIEFPPVYMKRLLKVPGKLGLVTEENLVQPNLCLDVLHDNIKLLFQIPNTFGRKEIISNLTNFFGHPVTKFKVCKSVHHHAIQINQPTRCNNLSSLLLDVYVQLNVFRASSRPSSGTQQLQ